MSYWKRYEPPYTNDGIWYAVEGDESRVLDERNVGCAPSSEVPATYKLTGIYAPNQLYEITQLMRKVKNLSWDRGRKDQMNSVRKALGFEESGANQNAQ
jgi:hypothetical protein